MTKTRYILLTFLGILMFSVTLFGQKNSKNEELPPAYTSADEFLMLNSWDKDGTPMVVNGNGHQIDYHENGKVKGEGNYANGKKEGYWIFFHTNGKKESEGNFKNGNPSGKWKYYYPKGKLRTEIEYTEN